MSNTDERHSTRVHLMMSASELQAIHDWRRRKPDLPARAEAIRLIQLWLTGKAAPPQKRRPAPAARRHSPQKDASQRHSVSCA
jgi:hypothetical protein